MAAVFGPGDTVVIYYSGQQIGPSATGAGDTAFDYQSATGRAYGNSPDALGGGEFVLTSPVFANPNNLDGFTLPSKTFCLEENEFFHPGATYTVDNVNTLVANGGGIAGQDVVGGDTISQGTVWLYDHYLAVSGSPNLSDITFGLSGNYKYSDDSWAEALQLVFWKLEDELTATDLAAFALNTKALDLLAYVTTTAFVDLAAATANATLASDVRVLNISDSNGAAQSMLFLKQSNAVDPTPEPASLVLWGLGAGLAGLVSYRRNRQSAV